jgi:GTPase SAR1 family protein/predicted MPP superfamily phosphohydrolase
VHMPNETANGKIPPYFHLRHILRGHESDIGRIAWSPDGQTLVSGSADGTIRTWNMETGELGHTLREHSKAVYGLTWSPDGRTLASGSPDSIVRLWDMETGELQRELRGHRDSVFSVDWSPDGRNLASGSQDNTVLVWDAETGEVRWTLEHYELVISVAWSPDGRTLASGCWDRTISLWDADTGTLRRTLQGHPRVAYSVAWSPDSRKLASAHIGVTVLLWDPETGREVIFLEGHTSSVACVSFSSDGRLLASKSYDNTVRLWRCDTWQTVAVLDETAFMSGFSIYAPPALAFHPTAPVLATLSDKGTHIRIWELDLDPLLSAAPAVEMVHYVNAKAVLVGESGVGKSGLGIRIAEGEFRPTESTHGARFWQIPAPQRVVRSGYLTHIQAELTLCDLAGQPEYRLVHQLFFDDSDVVLLLFDCSDPTDPFRGVPYWAKVLRKQTSPRTLKFLVSARCDVSPVTVDRHAINRVLAKYEFLDHLITSAKTGQGVEELMQRVLKSIPWDELPCTTTPRLFQVIRAFLLEHKAMGDVFVSMEDIRLEVHKLYTEREATSAEMDTVVDLLQARGLIHRLDPTPKLALVLLRPELINQYASSIIQAARNHPRGVGAIAERDIVTANLPFIGFERLGPLEEKTVLESTVELFIRHDLCFREMGMLVFPSQLNVTRPDPTSEHPPAEVTYRFSGGIETIYASLVVRLSYTDYFQREDQWRYAVEFSRDGDRLGLAMRPVEEGTGELEIYFYPDVSEFDRVTFIRFITDHLRSKGIDIEERIRLYCRCGEEVKNRDAVEARVQAGKLDIPCQYCGAAVIIPSSIEEIYHGDRSYVQKQQQLVEAVERRTAREVVAFKNDQWQYTREKDHRLHILHLSDIHLGTPEEARKYRAQLETDLKLELKVHRLEYLVISGDVANCSTAEEYDAAFELVDGLVKRFGLDVSRVVVVPGNHDLNWDLAEEAYPFVSKRKLPDPLPEGRYIPAGEVGVLVRDENLYRQRFARFSVHFYKKAYGGHEYPLDYAEQGILHVRPDDRLLFLALNSSWELDHHYRDRASINMEALARALDQLQGSQYDDWLKIAVWHHPVTGREMMDDEFLQLLAVHDFQICMHGHIHEAIEGYHKYDPKRGLHIIGAGTFGAPTREQVSGIPLQYNLLALDPETCEVTVETRKKEKPDGAWSADARGGDKNDPKPRYTFGVKWGIERLGASLPQLSDVSPTIDASTQRMPAQEIQPAPGGGGTRPSAVDRLGSDSQSPRQVGQTNLRRNLATYFNREELRTLCFDLGIKHENLPDTLDGMARELIAICERSGRSSELIAACARIRPKVSW